MFYQMTNATDYPKDLREALPKHEDAIAARYPNSSALLAALNELMGY
jgi:hypothetical protein